MQGKSPFLKRGKQFTTGCWWMASTPSLFSAVSRSCSTRHLQLFFLPLSVMVQILRMVFSRVRLVRGFDLYCIPRVALNGVTWQHPAAR